MKNRLPYIFIIGFLTTITGTLFLTTLSQPAHTYAAGSSFAAVEINGTGFNPEQVHLLPGGQVVWHNATTRTITMTYGWPPSLHLPIVKDAKPTLTPTPTRPVVNPEGTPIHYPPHPPYPTVQPPWEFEKRGFSLDAGEILTVTFHYKSNYYWQIPSIPNSLIFVSIQPPTPTPTPSNTPTNTPTPWSQGDDDGDRLSNGAETDSGTYVSLSDTGTDPSNPDTDGDGIKDGDEVLGTHNGLRLDAMGVSPLKKDILVEIDWFDDDSNSLSSAQADCGFHSHKPSAGTLDRLKLVYAEAPVSNPDGSTGINLIIDIGGGWPFDGGEQIPEGDGILAGEINDEQHRQLKADHFASNRRAVFHYLLMMHEYRPIPTQLNPSSGLAEVSGDDVFVSMGCLVGVSYDAITASTIMHELGHNFGLRHGGPADQCNYKPNYNSIMNYRYQFKGLDSNCDGAGDGLGLAGRAANLQNGQLSEMMSYSDGSRLDLDENHLDERVGMCGAFIDWNKNFIQNILQTPLDINRYHPIDGSFSYSSSLETAECGGAFSTLRDYNEWENLNFIGVQEDGSRRPAELIYEAPIFELLLPSN